MLIFTRIAILVVWCHVVLLMLLKMLTGLWLTVLDDLFCYSENTQSCGK